MGNKPKHGTGASEGGRGSSELAAAATALEAELHRYDELAAEAQRVPLDTEKNLGRAARIVKEAAESQDRVGGHVAALVAAVSTSRERQQATAEALLARALVIQERVNRYETFMGRFDELGLAAKEINVLMQEIGARKGAEAKAGGPSVLASLAKIDEKIGNAIDRAKDLATEATAADVTDIAQRADALRQQMQAVRNKLRLVQKGMAPSTLN